MARVHANAYAINGKAEVVGIVDPNPQAKELSAEINAKLYSSLDEVPSGSYDVADICSPTYTHAEYARKAAKAGKDVFCEKPLARTMEEASEIVEVCEKNSVRLSVGQVVRFFPQYVRAKKVIESGQIGKVVRAFTQRGGDFPKGWDNWYGDLKRSGGTLVDLVIHDFDFLRWVFGPVERVYSTRRFDAEARIDYSITTLKFRNGLIADSHGVWTHGNFRTKFEFSGTEGLVTHDSDRERQMSVNPSLTAPLATVKTEQMTQNPYYLELENFLDCLDSGEEFKVTGKDALESLKVSLAAEESSRTGSTVYLEVSR